MRGTIEMRTCPYCGQEAMSAFRKATVGVMRVVKCQACGKRVSVSWLSLLGLAALLLGGVGAALIGYPAGLVALVAGGVAMFLIHEAVPVVGRDV